MSDLPEISERCRDCGGYVLIPEGEREGYCYNIECGAIIRRPPTGVLVAPPKIEWPLR